MFKNVDEVKSLRNAYGETLVELGKENENVVVLDADLSCSTQTAFFKKEFPNRFFNVGISEQDLMTTAAGMAIENKIPFVSTFSMFCATRALDQVRNTICYSKLNVKIVGTHGGITVGEDGASHQALEDIAAMRALPDMTVIVPSDYTEVKKAIRYAAEIYGPVFVRIPRTNLKTIFCEDNYVFNPERAVKIQDGNDVTIVTNGETLQEVISCVKMLENDGIKAEVLHIPVVKPFFAGNDIIESAKKTGKVVVVENHSIIGGLGSAVCETLSENHPTKVLRIGTNDCFGQSGDAKLLVELYGLSDNKIYERVKQFI